MTASEELENVETSTDWAALIELALANPPAPHRLAYRFSRWQQIFKIVHARDAINTEYPLGMDAFLRKLAFAAIPPAVIAWVNAFERKHGRKPTAEELPADMLALLPKGKAGRPRCDTQRIRGAARAWEAEIFRASYETRREGIEIGKEAGFENCFGFNQVSMQGDQSYLLALEKLSEETGKSVNYLLDYVYPNRH